MRADERFLKYISFATNSDENSETVPSTPEQKLLGAYLAEELAALGLRDAHADDKGYVYAFLPATAGRETEGNIGFIAHMDTSPSSKGDDIRPEKISYGGGDIPLKGTGKLSPEEFPSLTNYIGKELIVTDGTTLLGADDKAGIAEIVTACEYLLGHPEISHRGVALCFTPDEEIGRGADFFDHEKFNAHFAYTVDGGALGEIEYENFNAASAKITVNGVNIHPGSAKNKMKNAVLLACEFISRMPAAETPAHTEGYEGFYHLCDMSGDETKAHINIIIRDHNRAKFTERKEFVAGLADYMNSVYGERTFIAEIKDSYYNMKEKILPCMWLIENAKNAMLACGAEPKIVPIRGGTDGARLSYEGLPCPNLSTGGENFHGVHEFVCVEAMHTMTNVLVELTK